MEKDERDVDLRRQAEARLSEFEEESQELLSEVDARALVHELQVHQIELEMQNEELVRARAEAEDALERYTDLYDFAPIGYFTLDHRNTIVESNLAGAELLGETRSQLVGADFRLYVSQEFLSDFQECFREVFETDEKHACEVRLKRGGRSGPYVRLVGSATVGGREQPRLCRLAAIDVSERRHAEAMLRRSYDEMEDRVVNRTSELAQARGESEHRAGQLQSFFSSMADGVLIVDVHGNVIYANDAALHILGAPADEAFEDWQTRYPRFTLSGEPFPVEETSVQRALRGETVRGQTAKSVSPWGQEVSLSITAAPVYDAEGAIVGATTVFHDISERIEIERTKQELLEREHHIAEVLQQALVPPQQEYEFSGCRISVRYQAASKEAEVGGDFYDIFRLDDGKIGILIGDVVGKGLSAAMQVAAARYSIRSYAFVEPDPAVVMTLANETLCREQGEPGETMLTALFAVLDASRGTLTYTSAGHEPPIVRDGDCAVTDLNHIGRAMSVLPGFAYSEAVCTMQPADVAVLVTDGITEAMNRDRDMFGREGLMGYLETTHSASSEEIASGLLEAATSYAGGSLRDDAVVIVVELVQP